MAEHVIQNVGDYPRPPAIELFSGALRIDFGGRIICKTNTAWRVLETFHPPTYYIAMDAFAEGVLVPAQGSSMCEWKGQAAYFDVVASGKKAPRAAWTYRRPAPRFAALKDHVAVYAEPMDACFIDGETVEPQPGNFYGGWKTSWITGPIKGAPGTTHW